MRRAVILVPTDFSEGADTALDVAARYARALGGRLCLLHVLAAEQIDVSPLLADAVARAGSDVPVTVARTGGDPATEILRYAKRHPIDLIVVGTHGHAGATRELLGNVADRVVRSARCPVLVVPAPAGSRPARRRRPVRRSAPLPRQRGGIQA